MTNKTAWYHDAARAFNERPDSKWIKLLHRRVAAHDRMMENVCNEAWASEEAYQTRIKNARRTLRVMLMAHPNVAGVVFGGDPRGCTVKVILKDGRANTWDTASDGRRYFGL